MFDIGNGVGAHYVPHGYRVAPQQAHSVGKSVGELI